MWYQALLVPIALILIYWYLQDDKLHTLKGKRVVVTGASDGIGEQLAYHYARLGAQVVVTARREEKLKQVVKECESLSPSPDTRHFAVPADMLELDRTKYVIETAIQKMGGLDVLVLNHIKENRLERFEGRAQQLQDLHQLMDINFRAYVHLTSHALPQLMANNGSIIVVNSVAGRVSQPYVAAYSASKFALNGFFNSLRNQFEVNGQNVSITSCTVGLIGTANARKYMAAADFTTYACPNATALDIVKAGARRVSDVYTPFWGSWPIVTFHSLWPAPVERLSSYIMHSAVENR